MLLDLFFSGAAPATPKTGDGGPPPWLHRGDRRKNPDVLLRERREADDEEAMLAAL